MKQPYPPVGRMRMALDQRQRLELVDDAAKRDRLDLQEIGQAALVDALVLRQIGQDLPLRTREAGTARVLLEALPEQSRDFMEQKPKCRRIRFHRTHLNFISKLMISLDWYISSASASLHAIGKDLWSVVNASSLREIGQ